MPRFGSSWESLKKGFRKAAPKGVFDLAMHAREAQLRIQSRHFLDFVFVHINKCGGTSVERALGVPFLNHRTAEEHRTLIGQKRFDERYRFTVVRNPYERMHSLFLYRHKTLDGPLEYRQQRFREWLEEVRANIAGERNKFLAPARDWIVDPSTGEILVEHAYTLETLGEQWPQLRERLPRATALDHLNRKAGTRVARELYDESSFATVAELFAEDFALFGYNPDPAADGIPEQPIVDFGK